MLGQRFFKCGLDFAGSQTPDFGGAAIELQADAGFTRDLGAPAAKKYDCEGWFPFQERYRELTSTSNTTDFQARRLGVRYRDGKSLEPVHTLNGTAATDRAVLAILENFQGAVPDVLRAYGAPATVTR